MNKTALISAFTAFLLVQGAIARPSPADYLKKPDTWFAGPEATQVAAAILSYQFELGGWPKNIDTTKIGGKPKENYPTFDNNATMNEMRFLARIHVATHDASYASAFDRGLDYILKAQYPTGGWPQSYPPDESYHRYITFNDNAMVNLMNFIREVSTDEHYAFVQKEKREACAKAFDRGVQCILKCQVKKDGKPTAWCAQHDERDYSPRPARAFEPMGLSGSESVGIVRLLMSLERPDEMTVAAIEGSVAWFDRVKITGHKVVEVADDKAPGGKDDRLVEDPAAPPMWARFYEINTDRPIFSDRDSSISYDYSQIGYERRNGYTWLGDWPQNLLEKEYPKWRKAHGKP